jgi:Putative beta-barrel porin 2
LCRSNVKRFAFASGSAIAGLVLSVPAHQAQADETGVQPLVVYGTEQFAYDSNLFRLPFYSPTTIIGPHISAADHIDSVSAGAQGQWTFGLQVVTAQARADYNHFSQNTNLNNTSGIAALHWDWLLSPFLSGAAGADFSRTLASYQNTRFFGRDLVDTTDYYANGKFRFATHWRIKGGAKGSDTTHSLAVRRNDNYRTQSGNAGIEYFSDELNHIGVDYQFTNATFSQPVNIAGLPYNANFKESLERILATYAVTGKTSIDLAAGYLTRHYPNGSLSSYSGNTWRAQIKWLASGKTQLVLAAWRELTAYFDAESDYFVARGESATAMWDPTVRLEVSLQVSRIRQNYISSSPSAFEFAARRDRLNDQKLTIKFSPRDPLALQLSYRLEQRDSNESEFPYHDRLATANLTYSF